MVGRSGGGAVEGMNGMQRYKAGHVELVVPTDTGNAGNVETKNNLARDFY